MSRKERGRKGRRMRGREYDVEGKRSPRIKMWRVGERKRSKGRWWKIYF